MIPFWQGKNLNRRLDLTASVDKKTFEIGFENFEWLRMTRLYFFFESDYK